MDLEYLKDTIKEIKMPDDMKKRIVDTALDSTQDTTTMKKICNLRRFRPIPICAALLAALTLTGFAVYYANSVLLSFNGDLSLVEPYIQQIDESTEKGEYCVTVDSVLSDAHSTVIGVTVEALTDDACIALNSADFNPARIMTFNPKSVDSSCVSVSYTGSPAEANLNQRSFAIRLEGVGAPNVVELYLNDNADDPIVLEIDKQIESLSVEAERPTEIDGYFIRNCTLNATGVDFDVEFAEKLTVNSPTNIIEIYFRMSDGSLKTLTQICGEPARFGIQEIKGDPAPAYRYTETFATLVDPLSVTGVVMNGREYSFVNPEYNISIDIPDTMRPFLTEFIEIDDVFYFCANDVCEHIGASIEIEGNQYTIQYLGREYVFSPEDTTVTVDGQVCELEYAAVTLDNGELALSGQWFSLLELASDWYYSDWETVRAPDYWLVTP